MEIIKDLVILIISFFIPFSFGLVCYDVAQRRNRNEKLWFILGMFGTGISLFILLAMGYKEPEEQGKEEESTS